MNIYVEAKSQEKVYEGFDYTDPAFIRDLFENSDEWKHLPKKQYAICLINAPVLPLDELLVVLDSDTDENYKDAVLRSYSSKDSVLPPILSEVLEDNKYYGTPGTIPSHVVDVRIKDGEVAVELPEVQVWDNTKPYVKRMKNAEAKHLEKELFKTLCFVYRLGMDDREVVTAAVERGMEYKRVRAIQYASAKKSADTKTIDELYMVDWFERAVKHCNSWNQVDVLIHVYIEACTYGNLQPVISKQRIAERAGVDRVVVRRLFARLEKAGILKEGPVTFKSGSGYMKNARIVNLNPDEAGRWGEVPDSEASKKATHTITPDTQENASYVASEGSNEPDWEALVGNKSWEEAEPTW